MKDSAYDYQQDFSGFLWYTVYVLLQAQHYVNAAIAFPHIMFSFFGTTIAQSAAPTQAAWLANINWAAPTWDLFIILFFVAAALIYGMSLGRDRLVVILVSIYMSLAVVHYAPLVGVLQRGGLSVDDDFFAFRIGVFLAAFIVLFFAVSRSALMNTIARRGESTGSFWQVILFSILQVGLLISIVLSFLPKEAVSHLASLTKQIFVDELAQFLWIIVPIVMMAILPGGTDEEE